MHKITQDQSDKPSVNLVALTAAVKAMAAMSVREKEEVCDTLYATQPNLLGLVLVQSSMGASMETVDVLLDILIVLHLAIANSGQLLETISEEDLERNLERVVASINFTEGLDEEACAQSIQQSIAYKKEKIVNVYKICTAN